MVVKIHEISIEKGIVKNIIDVPSLENSPIRPKGRRRTKTQTNTLLK
jgi:hypothetical protein